MGKISISLPDEMLDELGGLCKPVGRSLSSEIRMRLDYTLVVGWVPPTGVAEVRVGAAINVVEKGIPVVITPIGSELVRGETRHVVEIVEGEKMEKSIEGKLEPVREDIRVAVDDVILKGDGEVKFDVVAEPVRPAEGVKAILRKEDIDKVVSVMDANPRSEETVAIPVTGPSPKFPGVSDLAKKIAKDIPGVKVASETGVFNPIVVKKAFESLEKERSAKNRPECLGGSFCECASLAMKNGANRDTVDQLERDCRWVTHEMVKGKVDDAIQEGTITDEDVKALKSTKKRPETTGNPGKIEGPVEMVKGFWRDRFLTEEEARAEAMKMNWAPGEYEIKPLK